MDKFILLLGVSLFSVASLGAEIFYVNASVAGGTGDGSSWEDAFVKLQDALVASSDDDLILVAKGVYYPDEGGGTVDNDTSAGFEIPDGVSLIGGLLSGQNLSNPRDLEMNRTVLSGDIEQDDLDPEGDGIIESNFDINGPNTLQIVKPAGEFFLDGFVINAGAAGGTLSGGGIIADQRTLTVRNCIIQACSGANGGGASANGASGSFENCSFISNAGAFRCGGLFAVGAGLNLINCDFIHNSGFQEGGALIVGGAKIAGCRFMGNVSARGSAISAKLGSPQIQNCVFHNNYASSDGTLYLEAAPGTVIGNCTFSGNSAEGLGGAIYAEISGTTTISHCIIWGNESGDSPDEVDFHVSGPNIPAYRHCLIEGWNPAGIGNIDGTLDVNKPLFVSPPELGVSNFEGVDLRLLSNSSGVNQGGEDELAKDVMDLDGDGDIVERLPIDADGKPRILFSKPDLGAYEASSSVLFVKGNAAPGGDGASWTQAMNSLAAALKLAEAGQDIWVSQGEYLPTVGNPDARGHLDRTVSFSMKSGVGVYGGFEGHELAFSDRKPSANRTLLGGDIDDNDGGEELKSYLSINGENSYHVVCFKDTDETAILDGFVVTGGQAEAAGGETLYHHGGGIFIQNADARIRNCVLTGNSALDGNGGGMHSLDGGKPSFVNCLFRGNGALFGSAATVSSGTTVFVNCTMTQNTTTQDPAVSGAFFISDGDYEMENSIVWGNVATNSSGVVESIANLTNQGEIRHSLVEHSKGSGAAWRSSIGVDGGGNLDVDPKFADSDDFRLWYDSPVIDAGNNLADLDGDGAGTTTVESLNSNDLADLMRIVDGDEDRSRLIDMGAYEYQGRARSDIDDDGLSDFFELQNTQPASATLMDAEDDMDGDGLNNLEEFVFGKNPDVWDQSIVPIVGEIDGEDRFGVEYQYNEISSLFVDLAFEWSSDLDQWTPIDGDPIGIPVDNPLLYQIYPSEEQSNGGKGFIRYHVKKK